VLKVIWLTKLNRDVSPREDSSNCFDNAALRRRGARGTDLRHARSDRKMNTSMNTNATTGADTA
jgi:hypothetical protein